MHLLLAGGSRLHAEALRKGTSGHGWHHGHTSRSRSRARGLFSLWHKGIVRLQLRNRCMCMRHLAHTPRVLVHSNLRRSLRVG